MCVRVCVDSVYADDAEEAVKQVQILLEENSVDVAVRIGDLCGFLIEHFARKQKWQAVKLELPRIRRIRIRICSLPGCKI